ncbi:MAG: tRNA dihydrouridine(20/20a) synthase DusA [Alcanivorax sp.]|uniref:tRNA dihydrouridine(20/20a) synthase DusA n=1 Tax=Alcanivorax sp. TaxID=1872427 RepID=UPI0019C6736A|nr:tRNA dihydrouridine(20/20a) synthase DusA [Alcanivorax sp.]MBD3644757.1 tRNA dihydrouridine(20/20a) synthase DusA [Alcanivorax sp.]MDF1724956.1 tRNA dihydrouridine(20/20a) synthase DusA [Alcanivorax sp.]
MNDSLIQTAPSLQPDRRLSVAPMMDWTTRDYRFLARLITRHTLLYTEMVVAQAILRGDRERFLAFNDEEHPVALQLGGCEPQDLAEAARIAEQYGYDEINLNVGCPSDRVQQGKIGAILMAEPELVGQCVEAMQAAVSVPVTVKTRIGIDDQDDYDFLYRFVTRMEQAGCTSLTIHARKAILSGLSPKENREIPPLIYQRAYAIKQAFPHMEIILNGGVKTLDEVHAHMGDVDGVMIGREAYQNPYFLANADRIVFADDHPVPSRRDVAEQFLPYVERRYALGHAPKHSLRHILNLFQGEPGARRFRRHLSENMHKPDTTPQVLMDALAQLS